MATDKTRNKIVDAFLTLLSARDYSSIGLVDVAEAAEVSLGVLRDTFDGKPAIVAAFSRRIDQAMLAEGVADGQDERDRLLEVMMRRFDALRPHVAALRNLARSAVVDPTLACALLRQQQESQKWTLAAAGIHRGGAAGIVAINGAVLIYADVMRTFLEDDDPGLGRTMAALDRALQRGGRVMRAVDGLCALLPRPAERRRTGGPERGAMG
jgi:AcrR family transcriptional regulator